MDAAFFIIGHWLSTVCDADEIMVFDSGQIVERGSFDALVRLGCRFAELVRTQLTSAEPMAEAVKAAE